MKPTFPVDPKYPKTELNRVQRFYVAWPTNKIDRHGKARMTSASFSKENEAIAKFNALVKTGITPTTSSLFIAGMLNFGTMEIK